MYSDRYLECVHKTGRGTSIIKLYYEKPPVYYQTLLLLNIWVNGSKNAKIWRVSKEADKK